MVGREISPTEIGKHAKLIKSAQEEMATMDVLVCGRCLNVFHFIEDFKMHKQKTCFKENNNVRECNDTKPKIWAFLLWKATQLHNNKDNNITSPNSWALYQTWVKMDESLRETWIVAGKTIQSFAKVSQGNLQEMPVKITKTVVNNNSNANSDGISPGRKPLTQTKPQVANLKPPVKLNVSNKSTADSENETSPLKSPLANNAVQKIMPKKPITVSPQLSTKPTPATATPPPTTTTATTPAAAGKPLTRRAKRSVPNSEEVVEENVEKIVAKRFNPRRRMHEYLVKWENRALEQNTWEPASHLENVPHLLETFEKQLARQKETRAALQAKQQAATGTPTPGNKLGEVKVAVKDSPTQQASPLDTQRSQLGSPSDRPQRSSKTKAMDQVKQWVAGNSVSSAHSPNSDAASHQNENDKDWPLNTSTGSGPLGGLKRKLDDSDYNDSNADEMPASTTNTMEDLEEDLIPSHTLKKMKYGNSVSVEVKTKTDVTKQIKVNGTATARNEIQTTVPTSSSSAEVIITQDTSASGVVKKPGFTGTGTNNKPEAQVRILSKGESAISNSGIVRVGSVNDITNATSSPLASPHTTPIAENKTQQLITRTQHVRTAANPTGRSTPTPAARPMVQQQIVRTPSGTTIQRKSVPATGNSIQRGPGGTLQSRTMSQASPSSGRMIIPRQGMSASSTPRLAQQKAVTPEQKILQLSKSGDLKVTKKVMTREDVVAQRQQHQQLQQRQRQQSQVHIQKVQQLSGPAQRNSPMAQRKPIHQQQHQVVHHHQQQQQQEEEHQARLCPITGNIIGGSQQEDQQNIHVQAQLEQQQQQQQHQITLQQEQQQQQQQLHDIDPNLLLTQDQMLTNEDGTPLLVTGEDGTVYQVAGKNAEGQTILVTQGPDGEQHFAYVAAAEGENENQAFAIDNAAVAEAVAQLPADQQAEALAAVAAGEAGNGGGQYLVKTTQEDGTTQVVTMTEAELQQHQAAVAAAANAAPAATNQLCIQTGDGSDGQANIPAEVVQAELPSPGGTRRVVLLLQDGTFMMTEMHDDEFKALNIAA
ncbi:myb-like protein Q [Musca vetustissima]|uniref:myb-like protein Q n=1 Tax=Musca vetustissima TaxID=27455 RepID=UPI002AB780C8|nr:myb-like protein Q [Musca vetustissima]